jgi:uncharacterized protein YndB with AHSA1/START domain
MAADDDEKLLSVEIHIEASPALVWQVLTERQPDWWCPKPWTVEIIEQDWRAGGRAAMIMRGPNGEEHPQEGIFLEVTPGVRFVSTDAFTVGWKPAGPFMVGTWEIQPDGTGTLYRGSARHWSQEAYEQHKTMGFEAGWMAVAEQLKALCESLTVAA